MQVVKRKGFNLIDTATLVKDVVAEKSAGWPEGLRAAVEVGTSNDQSRIVDSMVQQLLGSVFTAIALVMIVALAALGIRASLLVGFAIPTSFLLCFAFLALMGISISNIVMFGLILSVGLLVDGAIVLELQSRPLGGERYDISDTKFGALLNDKIHAIAAGHGYRECDGQR